MTVEVTSAHLVLSAPLTTDNLVAVSRSVHPLSLPLGSTCSVDCPFLVLEQMEIGKGEVGETDPDRKASTKGPQRVRDRRKTVGFGEDTSTFILELEPYLHAHEAQRY